jgi:hypothetical protein
VVVSNCITSDCSHIDTPAMACTRANSNEPTTKVNTEEQAA